MLMTLRCLRVEGTIFIAESGNALEKKAFERLAQVYEVVKNTKDCPISSTPDYATISFGDNNGFNFHKGYIYELEFDIRKRAYCDGKDVHFRCFIKGSKKVREALSEDLGELVFFTFFL